MFKSLISWQNRVVILYLAPLLYFKIELHRKMMTRITGYCLLNENKELQLDYMENDYMRIKRHKIGYGTSMNLKVVSKSPMMLFEVV